MKSRLPDNTGELDRLIDPLLLSCNWRISVYKNLDGEAFGVTGRQNEVIELALSFSFKGINVDLNEMLSRAKASGQDFATRYIASAKKSSKLRVGGCRLPIKIAGEKAAFETALEKLKECCEIAKAVEATNCTVELDPASDTLTFQDNFELHRERLGIVADRLNEYGMRLGIGFNAIPKRRAGKAFEFIYEAEPTLTLIKTIGRPNVGLAFDAWHWVLGDGGMDQLSELKPEQIITVRLADIPDNADPAKISPDQKILAGSAAESKCETILKHLYELGYTGPITPGQSASSFGAMPRESMVRNASDRLDDLMEAAGIPVERRIPAVVVPVPDEEEEEIEGLEDVADVGEEEDVEV
jgi:sugar phosphate isomerase/epimerase